MRYLVSVGAGLTVALLLFLLMHFLISGEEGFDKDAVGGAVVDFIRIKEDEMTRLKERTPPRKPPPPKDPPPPPKLKVNDTDKPPPVRLDIATPKVNVPVSTGDGPYIGQWKSWGSGFRRRRYSHYHDPAPVAPSGAAGRNRGLCGL